MVEARNGRHRATAASSPAITVTWAATSKVPAERVRIGKAWTPEGKWPVTDGVQRLKYFLEQVDYPNLEALAIDIERRIAEGSWTMVTGVPRAGLDLTRLHARAGKNFADAPTTLLRVRLRRDDAGRGAGSQHGRSFRGRLDRGHAA